MDETPPTTSTASTNNIEDAPQPTHEDEQQLDGQMPAEPAPTTPPYVTKPEMEEEVFEPDWNAFI
eukprot:11114052-Prorocentrum_lima.AAC.1